MVTRTEEFVRTLKAPCALKAKETKLPTAASSLTMVTGMMPCFIKASMLSFTTTRFCAWTGTRPTAARKRSPSERRMNFMDGKSDSSLT